MSEKVKKPKYLNASDVQQLTGQSRASSYRIIKALNDELKEKGYMIIPGRISKKYFMERFYWAEVEK